MTANIILPCKLHDAEKIERYLAGLINTPWLRDGRHCWRLVVDVQRDLFGRSLPPVMDVAPSGHAGRIEKSELFLSHPERANWMEVSAPTHGSVELLRRSAAKREMVIHAGVYLDIDGGGILHCDAPHGVVFDGGPELALRGWAISSHLMPRIA